jgi:hypothetical protein
LLAPMPVEQEALHQAVTHACRKWPALSKMVQEAARLVAADCVYQIPGTTEPLAVCKPAGGWEHGVVRATAAGFACTCSKWPPQVRVGPGDGLYCADILAYLLALYLQRPLPPLPYTPDILWQTTLAELQNEMLRATYNLWLADTRVLVQASSPTLLTVAARNRLAQEWLERRLNGVILRTLRGIAGYPIDVQYVVQLEIPA